MSSWDGLPGRSHDRPTARSARLLPVGQQPIDLRKCPDASTNCDDAPVCENTTSGCRGGTDSTGDGLCQPGLTGVFCRQCALNNSSTLAYYRTATNDEIAGCDECQDTLGTTFGVGIGSAIAASLLLFVFFRWYRQSWSATRRERVQQVWAALKPLNKLKIATSFYMIATRIDSVYEVC